MLQTLKAAAFHAAKTAGFFDAVANSNWRRNRLLILAYHGIALDDEHLWNPAFYITADFLRRRLEILRQCGCSILPLGEAIERLKNRTLPARSVVITFDDGFHDFHARAMSVLRAYRAPATVYVSSYYSHFERPVFNPMLDYLLWKGTGRKLAWPELLGHNGHPPLLGSENRSDVLRRLSNHCCEAGYSAAEKDAFLGEVAGRLGIDYEDLCSRRILQLMNPDELRAVRAEGFDIQLHTHRHRMPQAPDLFLKEIEDNRLALDLEGTGNGVFHHFCYPSGVYYPESAQLLRQCGVLSAASCDPGMASPSTDLHYLPRFCDSMCIREIIFEGWATGAARLLPHKRRKGCA